MASPRLAGVALAAVAVIACSAAERDLDQGDAGADTSTEYPTTCADVRASSPSSGDGDYALYVEGDAAQPWTAFCLDMAGEPKEYLTLAQTGPDQNFSQYTAGGASPGTDVRTNYTRIRIRPSDLLVDISDQTFSSSSGQLTHTGDVVVTDMPYAVAMACSAQLGHANIDLTGTPFRVIDPFCQAGAGASGNAAFTEGDQVVDLTGTGTCGWTAPHRPESTECLYGPYNGAGGFILDLAYAP